MQAEMDAEGILLNWKMSIIDDSLKNGGEYKGNLCHVNESDRCSDDQNQFNTNKSQIFYLFSCCKSKSKKVKNLMSGMKHKKKRR